MSMQRSVSYLRTPSPYRLAPCAGCGNPALSDRPWSTCSACMARVRASLEHLPGWQQRDELRAVLRSPLRVRAAVADTPRARTASE